MTIAPAAALVPTLLLIGAAHPVAAQERDALAVIEAVRAGGVTLVCRHAITDSFSEREPLDYDDPTTQRRLSDEGERQSAAMGRAMRSLGIDVAEAVASPVDRAIRTAELMLGTRPAIDSVWHTNDGRYEGPARDLRLERLALAVPPGRVRIVISHIGTMGSVLPDTRGMDEGDCMAVRPRSGGFDVVGVVPWRAWQRAAGTRQPDLRPGTGPVLARSAADAGWACRARLPRVRRFAARAGDHAGPKDHSRHGGRRLRGLGPRTPTHP